MRFTELNKEQFSQLLNILGACEDSKLWTTDKTAKEAVETCYRGDWLLWLYKKIAPNNIQQLTLAKGHSANTVRDLMKDERSKKAVDAAIAFGEGNITLEELNAAADAAYVYASTTAGHSDADAHASTAAHASADDHDSTAAAAAAHASVAYAYAAIYDVDAKQKNRLLTANVCRKYLQFDEIEIDIELV